MPGGLRVLFVVAGPKGALQYADPVTGRWLTSDSLLLEGGGQPAGSPVWFVRMGPSYAGRFSEYVSSLSKQNSDFLKWSDELLRPTDELLAILDRIVAEPRAALNDPDLVAAVGAGSGHC